MGNKGITYGSGVVAGHDDLLVLDLGVAKLVPPEEVRLLQGAGVVGGVAYLSVPEQQRVSLHSSFSYCLLYFVLQVYFARPPSRLALSADRPWPRGGRQRADTAGRCCG